MDKSNGDEICCYIGINYVEHNQGVTWWTCSETQKHNKPQKISFKPLHKILDLPVKFLEFEGGRWGPKIGAATTHI
jgi:hypothetical protein